MQECFIRYRTLGLRSRVLYLIKNGLLVSSGYFNDSSDEFIGEVIYKKKLSILSGENES
jgi:hypothetical protein